MRMLTTAVVIFACVLCASAATAGGTQSPPAQAAQAADAGAYTAVVGKDSARFTMPVPARDKWQWRMKGTRERAREYAFNVKVVNEGQDYTFGFFLWKNPHSSQGSGSFSSLLEAGQKDLFAHTSAGHNTIVRDAGVSAKHERGRLVITVSGRRNVERLFSGRPAEVIFQTQMPGEPPTAQTVPVVYHN
jgi:hypothetical protein